MGIKGLENNDKENSVSSGNIHVRRRKRKMSKGKKRLLVIFMSLLFVLLTGGTFFYEYLGKFSKQGLDNVPKGDSPVNILLLGMDIGDISQKDNNSVKRTDTIMIVHFDPKDKSCGIVSIPRDTLMRINGKDQKINVAYELGGDKLIKTTIKDMLNTDIDYMVKLDYEGFRAVIDAIGGIDMSIDQDMIYDDDQQDLHIRFYKGEKVHLDGEKAEEFFRWRKNNDGTGFANGDLDRIENQHKFIEKVVEKLTSPAIITKVPKILNILPKYLETDLPPSAMLSYGTAMATLKVENVKMKTIDVVPKYIDNVSYVVFDKKKNSETIAMLNDSISTVTNVAKKDITIKVLNCTKIRGLAADMQKTLQDKGYSKITIGNGKSEYSKSEIMVKEDKYKAFLDNDVKIKNYKDFPEDEEEYDVIIMLGKDYKKFGEE